MHRKVLKVFNEMSTPQYSSPPSAEYFLKLAVTYAAGLRRGFISKLTQLKRFDWLPPADAQRCVDRLESAVLMGGLSEEAKVKKEANSYHKTEAMDLSFEYLLSTTLQTEETTAKYPVTFVGCVDIESPNILWEIKCLGGDLETIHFLQLASYAWLWKRRQIDLGNTNANISDKRFRLFNVLSGEAWEMDNSCMESDERGRSPLDEMMSMLFKYKYRTQETVSDDEFLESITNSSTESATASASATSTTTTAAVTPKNSKTKKTWKRSKVTSKTEYVDKYGIRHSTLE